MPSTLTSALALVFLTALSSTLAAQPLLYHVTTGSGELYLLGGTEVPDNSWLSPAVETALSASDELWIEVPAANAEQGIPAIREETVPGVGTAMHPAAVRYGYGNLSFGDYFDVAMGERSVVETQRLALGDINFRAMKPWLAYYTFYYAFWDQQQLNLVDPQETLIERFTAKGKPVHSLFADREAYYRFMGRMNDFAQTHYFQSLYNMIDAQRAGDYSSRYSWMSGKPDPQWLEATRTKTPNYYRFMFERHNPELAQQLQTLLESGGSYFVYLDVDKLLGADSVIAQLEAAGLTVSVIQ